MIFYSIRIKVKEFPREMTEQHSKATELVKDLIQKVLNRGEVHTVCASY